MSVSLFDERMKSVISTEAEIERISSGFVFTEGPVWHPYEEHLTFSDIAGNRIYRWAEASGVTVFRDPSNMANGNTFDRKGRLITCEHATSRLIRTEPDGSVTILASHYDGHELNSPNDVIVKGNGDIYFTDPDAGRREFFGLPRDRELSFCGVYKLSEDGDLTLLVDDFAIPNGLCFSRDESKLYVNDTARRHVREFDVSDDGTLIGGEVWAEVGGKPDERPPDGMKIDSAGHLFTTGPGGIHVFSEDRTRLGALVFEENVANFAWGGTDLRTLFVTASTSLFRVRLLNPGLAVF